MGVQLSAEARLFWRDPVPSVVGDWFHRGFGFPPGGGKERIDEYLRDRSTVDLGIKRRGGKPGVEIKALIQGRRLDPIALVSGPVEVWGKWTTDALDIGTDVITIRKTRWLRKVDTGDPRAVVEVRLGPDEKPIDGALPDRGCNIELTKVLLADEAQPWWTLGFEAFGEFDDIVPSLTRTLDHLAHLGPPPLAGTLQSYPAWILSRFSSRFSRP